MVHRYDHHLAINNHEINFALAVNDTFTVYTVHLNNDEISKVPARLPNMHFPKDSDSFVVI